MGRAVGSKLLVVVEEGDGGKNANVRQKGVW